MQGKLLMNSFPEVNIHLLVKNINYWGSVFWVEAFLLTSVVFVWNKQTCINYLSGTVESLEPKPKTTKLDVLY